MFSRLDTIFKTQFRHAETTDTRQQIRREEKQGRRKQDHDDNHHADDISGEDSTTVSLDALKVFLENLIQGQKTEGEHTTETAGHKTPPTPTAPPDSRKQAQKQAINAYRTTAGAPESPPPPKNLDTPALNSEEQRMIHGLLQDIEHLARKNVTTLYLKPAGSFLESLARAVKDKS